MGDFPAYLKGLRRQGKQTGTRAARLKAEALRKLDTGIAQLVSKLDGVEHKVEQLKPPIRVKERFEQLRSQILHFLRDSRAQIRFKVDEVQLEDAAELLESIRRESRHVCNNREEVHESDREACTCYRQLANQVRRWITMLREYNRLNDHIDSLEEQSDVLTRVSEFQGKMFADRQQYINHFESFLAHAPRGG